jgi:hypothetical protein
VRASQQNGRHAAHPTSQPQPAPRPLTRTRTEQDARTTRPHQKPNLPHQTPKRHSPHPVRDAWTETAPSRRYEPLAPARSALLPIWRGCFHTRPFSGGARACMRRTSPPRHEQRTKREKKASATNDARRLDQRPPRPPIGRHSSSHNTASMAHRRIASQALDIDATCERCDPNLRKTTAPAKSAHQRGRSVRLPLCASSRRTRRRSTDLRSAEPNAIHGAPGWPSAALSCRRRDGSDC